MRAIIIEVEAVPSEAYWRAGGSRLVCGGDDAEEGRPGLRTPECPRARLGRRPQEAWTASTQATAFCKVLKNTRPLTCKTLSKI